MFNYPVVLTPDSGGTVLVRFPDLPGAVTFGDSEEEALARAVDALETHLAGLITDREDIPPASPARGRPTVRPHLVGAIKAAIYVAMRARGWRKADLAREMGLNPRQIDRLLDLRHASTVAQLEAALTACGRVAEVETVELPPLLIPA